MIARSVAKGHGAALRYVRRYPEGALFGHPIGYSFVRQGDTEFEQFHNDELVGERIRIQLDPRRADAARSRKATTSSPTSTRKRSGSRSAASKQAGLRRRGRDRAAAAAGSGCWPRTRPTTRTGSPYELDEAEPNEPELAAAQPRHPGPVPAGLDLQGGDRRRRPRQRHDHPGNADRRARLARRRRPAAAKTTSTRTAARSPSTRALTNSVNTWFAQLGATGRRGHPVRIHGSVRLQLEAGDRPALRRALDERRLRTKASCSAANDPVDIARVAIGQERLLVTPLQMAEVAAAVANGGQQMKPQIWSRVVDPDGRVVEAPRPLRVQPADQREDRRRADHGDGRRGQRRDRDQRGDLRASRSPARPAPRKRPCNEACGGGAKRTRPGSSASRRPTNRRSRSRLGRVHERSSATTSRRRSSAKSRKRS